MVATTTRNDLTTLFGVGAVGQLSDAELLTRFTAGQRDAVSEAAFEVIVARHGPMVLGVCRRVLGDAHAAADAFQTTFLVLSRNATSVHIEDSLGRWLYGVSLRVARRARAIAQAERARVLALNEFDPPDVAAPSDPCQHDDLRTAIDEEIARLPGRYRSVVVLCYLEGLTQEQAARRLRCPLGTVQSRLHRARKRLRSGLSRRGLAPTSWCSATLAAMTARAEVPPKLTAAIVSTGDHLTTGGVLGEAVPVAVAALVKQTSREILITKVWWMGLMLLAPGLSATGAVALAVDRRDGGGEKAKGPTGLHNNTPRASAGATTTSQTSLNGNQIRVAVDRNSNWIDSVWWFGTVDSPTVGYQRNGVYQASFTVPGAIYPDCDMDDWGNSYIVYQAPDISINNNPSIYLICNFLTPVKIPGNAGGVNPTVTVCRGRGTNSTNNGLVAIASNSGTVGGSGHYPTVMAAPYSFANGVYLGQKGLTTQPFTVNVCAARYQANSNIPIFAETVLAVPPNIPTSSGSFYYTQPHISCWSNGETVVLYNVPGATNLVAAHIAAAGISVNAPVQFHFSMSTPDALLHPGNTYIYHPNNAGVASLRSTPGSYVVTWPTGLGYNGEPLANGSNIVYQKVVGDTISPVGSSPSFITFVNHQIGSGGDLAYGAPAIALADARPFFIVWTLNPTTGTPVNHSAFPPPSF